MGIEFLRPWALLLIPLCIVATVFFERRIPRWPGRSRLKPRTVLTARILVVILLCLTLSGVVAVAPTDHAAAYILADLSGSTLGVRSDMENFIRNALSNRPEDYDAGIISFGQEALVELPLSQNMQFSALQATPGETQTNIEQALTLGNALLPPDRVSRLLVISDGLENMGDLQRMSGVLNVPVDVYLLGGETGDDVQVTQISTPSKLYQDESFEIQIRVDSTYATQASLTLYANREPIATREIQLQKGANFFAFRDTAKQPGIVTYEAQLTAPDNSTTKNNRMSAYTQVLGTPTILLVEGTYGDSRELDKILKAAGMNTEICTPATMPVTLDELRKHESVVLMNVSADDLSDDQTKALDSFVRQMGHGLLVTGGDNSYALGGYRGTALEAMLPVSMDVENRLDIPSLGLVMVIDKSGSMTEGRFGITKLELAKEAAARSTEVLTPNDQVGIICFDDRAKWVVEMTPVDDVAAIQAAIGTIVPGGGTMMFAAMDQALEALKNTQTKLKHVILLTDGLPGDRGFHSLAEEMVENGITLSTVAVGMDSDITLMEELAEIGQGRFYLTDEFSNIPKVFTKETFIASGNYLQNRSFFPIMTGQSSMTYAFSEGLPQLHGYVSTTLKPMATLALYSDEEEPILAEWQLGLGRVVCWTSDLRGSWTEDFLSWQDSAAFFAGLVSRTLPSGESNGWLEAESSSGHGRLTVTTDNWDILDTEALITLPDGSEEIVRLEPTAPGEYETAFDVPLEGAYVIQVSQSENGEVVNTLEGGLAVPYSMEYDMRRSISNSAQALMNLSQATGGRVISEASEVFALRADPVKAYTPIWPTLMPILLCLLFLDIALRRLSWEPWAMALAGLIKTRIPKRRTAIKPLTQKETAPPEPEKEEPTLPLPSPAEQQPPPTEAKPQSLLEARKNKKQKLL